MDRRRLLSALAVLPVAGPSSCWPWGQNGPGPVQADSGARALVDVHTHLFNASDLPVVRFLRRVLLTRHEPRTIQTLDIEDGDVIDGLLTFFTFIVGATGAPTAREEIEVLDRRRPPASVPADPRQNEDAVIGSVAAYVLEANEPSGVSGDPGYDAILQAIFEAAGESDLGVSGDSPLSSDEAQLLAERSYRSQTDLGRYLRWFALFTRYRHVLARQLTVDHRTQGFRPLLLAPALIDYDHWLGERVDRSPLPDQVAVMGRVARHAPADCAVHGYVAFDPLRQVYFDEGLDRSFDPLALVEHAITSEGFLGVKLYPPMGFRPAGNADLACDPNPRPARCYPEEVIDDLGGGIGSRLDSATDRLFELCARLGASVIAHAHHGNEAGPQYGLRGDPAFWVRVFDQHPTLRVGLGHFGRFDRRSVTAPQGGVLPETSWEWTLGRHIAGRPDSPVFADLSYFVAAEQTGPDRRVIDYLRRFIATFDPDCRHLMFGTDWTMLGQEAAYPSYARDFAAFFEGEIGLDEPRLHRVMASNAIRFLGLGAGQANLDRLRNWYAHHRLDTGRLDRIEAAAELQ